MDTQIVLSLVGLGVVVVLLAILAVVQQVRDRRTKEAQAEALRTARAGEPDAPAAATPFFIACFRGHDARFFRVYADAGRLLFLSAGPYFVMIDADTPRGTDQRHWMIRSLKMLAITLASGAVAAALGILAIARAMSRNAGGDPNAAGHFLTVVLGLAGLLAIAIVILVPLVLWRIDRRCRELDALPLSGLREQAELDKQSFPADPGNIAELTVSLLDQRHDFKPSDEVGGILSFQHKPTGRWKLETFTTRDTQAAVEAAVAVWGRDRVRIAQPLVDRLARFVTAGGAPLADLGAELRPLVADAQPRVAEEDERAAEAAEALRKRRAEAPRIGSPGSTFSMNGIGTMVCEAWGDIEWEHWIPDSDSIQAFCFLGIPLIPYRAVHTHDWRSGVDLGWEYQTCPIRWSWRLVGAAWMRRGWGVLVGVGILMMAAAHFGFGDLVAAIAALPALNGPWVQWLNQEVVRWLVAAAGLMLAVGAIAVRWRIAAANVRHQNIRFLLGRHVFGSSDPVYWTANVLRLVRSPSQIFGARTFGEAASTLAARGDFERAMFAARLSAALEDRPSGEELTDTILTRPDIAAVLAEIRRKPADRPQVLRTSGWNAAELFSG